MNVYCLHFDMKGLVPKAEFMYSLVPGLAAMGVSHLLVEFEDKFPFESFPAMIHPEAWTKDEFRKFQTICNDNKIEIIPLLQCAAHLDYFLKHAEYRQYRENGNVYQWCVSDPKTFDVWEKMYREIHEVFPDSRYFHIGADEVANGNCPKCGREAFRAFTTRVRMCCEKLVGDGITPLLWDDMLRKRDIPELDAILRKSILCVWQYQEINEEFIRNPIKKGWQVWGASCLEYGSNYHGLVNPFRQEDNLNDWASLSRKYSLQGNIGTLWGRLESLSPIRHALPAGLWNVAYWCEVMKKGAPGDFNSFLKKFGREFFGIENFNKIAEAMEFRAVQALAKLPDTVTKNKDIYDIVHVLAEYDDFFDYVNDCFEAGRTFYPAYITGNVPPSMSNLYMERSKNLRKKSLELREGMASVLGPYFTPQVLDEVLESRFAGIIAEFDFWDAIIISGMKKWQKDYCDADPEEVIR